ncbi:MAG: hypothetical protein K2X43_08070 [Hyphomonadaceae bacterium]|jgi:hypothetical protein|nr:hypothetical protein [Hyphomonadaceae bacterium]
MHSAHERLERPALIDGDDLLEPGRFGFEVDWSVHNLPGVWLRFAARAAFTPEQIGALVGAVDSAIAFWNQCGPAQVRTRAIPRVSADRGVFSIYIDLGTGGLEALAELLGRIDANLASAAVARCEVGHRPGH